MKTITMTNAEILDRLRLMKPVLSQRNKIGYVVARNYRTMTDALKEYFEFRDQFIEKYGEKDEYDAVCIKIDSPNFKMYSKDMAPLNMVEQQLNVMLIKYDEVNGLLSGEEILAIDWMLED